uniref:LisH domain-containing protein n=1 Tax=Panagrellus redivivus TaxID=6233 RepID=A0A7E4W951_PANRE
MPCLQTHLLYEALYIALAKSRDYFKHNQHLDPSERRFWQLTEPQHACALALSSSHGYKLVAYILQHFADRVHVEDAVFQYNVQYVLAAVPQNGQYPPPPPQQEHPPPRNHSNFFYRKSLITLYLNAQTVYLTTLLV